METGQPTIQPGLYTVSDLLALCNIAVNEGYDRRRIKLGGLGFDNLDERLRIPESATTFDVTIDGVSNKTFIVTQ